MTPLLEVEDLTFGVGGQRILAGVNLSVEAGEVVGIIGPNGAGKTAMLNCVSGIYRPEPPLGGGHVRFLGTELLGLAPHRVAAAGVARSFQHLELFPRLSLIDNLLVGRTHRFRRGVGWHMLYWGPARREEVEHREAAERMIDFFELWRYRDKPVASLPFGVQKLIGVARAMCAEPKVLLLDEPGGGMTREEKEDLARFLLRLTHEFDVAVVWVEHDLQLVMDLSHRLVALDAGAVISAGRPEEVRDDPAVQLAYLGPGYDALEGV